MFMVIPTWLVTLNYGDAKGVTFRVPQTNLDPFLHVLTFNNLEFSVEVERETTQEITP